MRGASAVSVARRKFLVCARCAERPDSGPVIGGADGSRGALARGRSGTPALGRSNRCAPPLVALLLLVLLLSTHQALALTASNASATTREDTPVQIDLTNNIVLGSGDTPPVNVTVGPGPSHGSVSINGFVVTYIPTPGFTGADSFNYVANCDCSFAPVTALVTVTVTAPPAPPPSQTTTPTLDPSVYGAIGAMEETTVLSAFSQINNFTRHLDNLHDVLRHLKMLGVSINGQSSPGASVRVASLASLALPQSLKHTIVVAGDARASTQNEQTAQNDAADAVPIELPDRIGLFVNGNLSLRQITGTGVMPDASPRSTSVSFGVDYRLNAGTIIGLGGGYTGNTTDIGGGSKSSADAFNITAYGTTRPIDPVYIDFQASYGHIGFHSVRDVSGMFVSGDPDGNQFWGSLTGGYEFDSGPYTFGPYLRVEGAHSVVDAFTETGPIALAVTASQQTVDALHSVIGFRGDRAISTAYGILSPHVRAEYLHEFIGSSGASVAFANGTASGFQVAGYPVSRNYATLGVGVSFLTVSALSMFLDYDALVGYAHQTDHSITGGISVRF
jgi:uncharacterized protein YhjY with autotransporter beta-barrel domain